MFADGALYGDLRHRQKPLPECHERMDAARQRQEVAFRVAASIVRKDAEVGNRAADGLRAVPQGMAVGVKDGAGPENARRIGDLVACRKEGDTQLLPAGQDREAGRGGKTDIERSQPAPLAQDGAPGGDILAGFAPVGAAPGPGIENDRVSFGADILLHGHRVAAIGHGARGEMRMASPRRARRSRAMPAATLAVTGRNVSPVRARSS